MQANSVKCTVCKKCIYKRCSGDLLRVVDGFRCKRCDGTIQEADLAEDVVMDGETSMCRAFFLSGRRSRWRWWSGSCCYS